MPEAGAYGWSSRKSEPVERWARVVWVKAKSLHPQKGRRSQNCCAPDLFTGMALPSAFSVPCISPCLSGPFCKMGLSLAHRGRPWGPGPQAADDYLVTLAGPGPRVSLCPTVCNMRSSDWAGFRDALQADVLISGTPAGLDLCPAPLGSVTFTFFSLLSFLICKKGAIQVPTSEDNGAS